MDDPIKCECENDKFWWFGEFIRCQKCFNEYHFDTDYDGNFEYQVRRFNHANNTYEVWEDFILGSFQQISDKGLESLSKEKFDKFIKEVRKIHPYIVPNKEIPSFHEHMERQIKEGNITEEQFQQSFSVDDSIVENATKANLIARMERETGRKRLDEIIEGNVNVSVHEFVLTDKMKSSLNSIKSKAWRKFWLDRWLFEDQIKRINEFKEGLRDNITHIINNP